MKYFAWPFVLTAWLLLGCHKKESALPAQSTDAPGSAQAQAQPVAGEVNADLTAQLNRFAQKNGRMPKSLQEFLDSVPRPPDGKKWVIDPSDSTVKAVPK
jgi:hypothetical protein